MSDEDLDRLSNSAIRQFVVSHVAMGSDEALELNQTMTGFVIHLNETEPSVDAFIKLILSTMQVAGLSLAYDYAMIAMEKIRRKQQEDQS